MKRQRGRGRKPGNQNNRSYESNGPDVKIRGNASHVYEKYLQLARDATSSGDRVMAENYYQHAEHYFRIVQASQPRREDDDDDGDEADGRIAQGQSNGHAQHDGDRSGGGQNDGDAEDGGRSGRNRRRRRRNGDDDHADQTPPHAKSGGEEASDPLAVVDPEADAAQRSAETASDADAEDRPKRRARARVRRPREPDAEAAQALEAADDGDSAGSAAA